MSSTRTLLTGCCSTKLNTRVRLRLMFWGVTKRVARITLVVSVSLWMVGAGCMWGCSNQALAAKSHSLHSHDQTIVVASSSCHAKTHDCCAKEQQSPSQSLTSTNESIPFSLFGFMPEGMMKDCPLANRASAVSTSKSNEAGSDLTLGTGHAQLPGVEKSNNAPAVSTAPLQFLNRGSTHLRCCVFRI